MEVWSVEHEERPATVVDYLERSPDFLTAKEIAEKQRVSIDFVRAALRAGKLKGHTIGGRGDWRVSTEDYEAWIAAGAPGAPSKKAREI